MRARWISSAISSNAAAPHACCRFRSTAPLPPGLRLSRSRRACRAGAGGTHPVSVTALVPVKGAALAKGRLASVLTPEERRALVTDMLRHVLDVLTASAVVDLVRLVGPEPWLATNDA